MQCSLLAFLEKYRNEKTGIDYLDCCGDSQYMKPELTFSNARAEI